MKTIIININMKRLCISLSAMIAVSFSFAQQSVTLDGAAAGKRFDGIGMVNGGGATAVLLKDYPEPQRSQIMDLVYRPMFGASVSSLLVEIPGDGNSTQGSMPSHEHERGKVDYHRGYMWWVLTEAKKRNPALTLDGAAWSAPGWIGNGTFFSQDGADYYVSWLRGLRDVYGLEMDAIGCRNEKGQSYDFVKRLRKTLDQNGFGNVKLHAFDNWYPGKLNFVKDMENDPALRDAIDIVSGHIFFEGEHVSSEVQAAAGRMGKPVWNTEDHIYLKGFDCLITLVKCFNQNFIHNGVTKIVNWYDIAGVYPMEPYSDDPPVIHAYEPWSGHYRVRQALWGYAHYGQFTHVGWHYLDGGCKNLDGGGSVVALASPDRKDYSLIVETKGAEQVQTLTLDIKDLPKAKLCVWKSDEKEQFVQAAGVKPRHGRLTLTLEPNTVYSLSTLTGQQKGSFGDIPASKPFPFPYKETFDEYTRPEEQGYLPRYTADICGAFELEDSALHQVVSKPAISWAPDWHYYTILGDSSWRDYEVAADIKLNPGDDAGVMGRICDVGSGYGFIPKGYYLQLNDSGRCQLVVVRGKVDKKKLVGDAEQQAKIKAMNDDSEGGEKILAAVQIEGVTAGTWHNLKLRFRGMQIEGFVDGRKVLSVADGLYAHGMAGLLAVKFKDKVSTPYFDNVEIK